MEATGLPLTASTTSPCCTPAFAAAPSAFSTTRPLAPTSPRSSRLSGRSARPSFSPLVASPPLATSTLSVLAPSVATTLSSFLSRHTSSVTLSPGRARPTRDDSMPGSSIASPLTLVITSPDFRPALAAALLGATVDTSAPSGRSSPKLSARSWVSGWIDTPRRACVAWPVATIWSLIASATSIGIAKLTPWKPPVRL